MLNSYVGTDLYLTMEDVVYNCAMNRRIKFHTFLLMKFENTLNKVLYIVKSHVITVSLHSRHRRRRRDIGGITRSP